MKRKTLFASIFLFGLCLASCAKPSFVFTDDMNLPYFDRDGDLFNRSDKDKSTYANVARLSSGEEIVNRVKDASEVFLFLYSNTCSHCLKFESTFTNFVLDSKIEANVFELSNGVSEINTLIAAFGDGNYQDVFEESKLETPSLYFLHSSLAAEKVDFSGSSASVDSFENFLRPKFNLSSIYHFRTYAGFESYSKENRGLVFFVDGANDSSVDFYDTELRAWAKHQDKNVALIEWNYLSDEDKSSFSSRFSLGQSYFKMGVCEIDQGFSNSIDYLTDGQSAKDLIKSIYQE